MDVMEGYQFEKYVAKLLRFQGFQNIKVTSQSNDWGADIIAERDSRRYSIQVKRWRKNVNHRAVKGAVFANACSASMVITNSYFTAEARKWASHYNCVLIDRDALMAWKRHAEKGVSLATA